FGHGSLERRLREGLGGQTTRQLIGAKEPSLLSGGVFLIIGRGHLCRGRKTRLRVERRESKERRDLSLQDIDTLRVFEPTAANHLAYRSKLVEPCPPRNVIALRCIGPP